MKVDLEKIRIAKSGIADNIYAGVLNKDNRSFQHHHDVTSDFLKAVIERFGGFVEVINAPDGKWEITVKKVGQTQAAVTDLVQTAFTENGGEGSTDAEVL